VSDDKTMAATPPDSEIPAGMTTLRLWAVKHGRTYDYVRQFWRRRDGFPAAAGELPARGRHGGGLRELLFNEQALDAWVSAQSDLEPPERFDLAAVGLAADDRITLGRFAAAIGKARATVTQHRDRPGFPEADDDGCYRADELLGYWNARPGYRGQARRQPRGTDG
jgi:hypothetical protein